MRILSRALAKGGMPKTPSHLMETSDLDFPAEALEQAWLEDAEQASSWDTVSAPAIDDNARALTDQDKQTPEPTLRDIFAVVTSCKTSINILTKEIKGVKLELNMVTQDM